MTEIFLKCNPPTATAQQQIIRRNGRVVPSRKTAETRAQLNALLKPHKPAEKLTGAIRLEVTWAWQKKQAEDFVWKTTRPDLDNLQKALQDMLTQNGFWEDDAQIAELITRKIWVKKNPGIKIKVDKLPDL
jgi:Holliday junction resolvase RusA-like endonuclease